MSTQHDYIISDQTAAALRADLNLVLAAIAQQNSGATEPAVMYPYMVWADTTADRLKIRNAANSAWLSVLALSTGKSVGDNNATYRNIHKAAGNINSAVAAGTFDLGYMGTVVSGGNHVAAGAVANINAFYLAAADFPTVNGQVSKLRVRAELYTNDTAPTGNFTFGLYPFTRPGTSGALNNTIYTLGTVVTGSTVLFTTPAADGSFQGDSGDFSLPADGYYVLGLITTATIATNGKVDLNATLQIHNP